MRPWLVVVIFILVIEGIIWFRLAAVGGVVFAVFWLLERERYKERLEQIWEGLEGVGERANQYWHIFSRDWFYTTNHKRLGALYLVFSAFSGIFGTTLASLVRLELGQPGSMLFWNSAGAYHTAVAEHALLMVFFVVTPAVFGGFGNYFLPLQIGARDVAYPRLNNFSVWLLPAGLIAMLRALWRGTRIIANNTSTEMQFNSIGWEKGWWVRGPWLAYGETRPTFAYKRLEFTSDVGSSIYILREGVAESAIGAKEIGNWIPSSLVIKDTTNMMAGWTFTTPHSHSRFTGRAVDMALAGLVFATIASIITTINLVTTWRFLRGRGARHQKELLPIFLICLFLSLRMLLMCSPILTAGFLMLIADRHFSTAFFTARAGGDLLLFHHLFWFFGHPEVYILVIPGFGYASTIVPYYVRKPVSSKMHMVYAMHAIACLGFVVWGHHLYLVGIDSKARTLFMTITIMIGLPSSLKVCAWVVSLANGLTFPSLDLWLGVVFISIFFVGGMSGLMVGGAGLDILLHDTYYVVGHFHVMLSGAMVLSLMGWIYFNFRELFGIGYIWLWAGLHLFTHVIGHIFSFIPQLWLGYGGMPRRVQDYPAGYAGWHSASTSGHLVVLIGLFCVLILFSQSTYFKRSMRGRHGGFPFIGSRASWLTYDKISAAAAILGTQFIGIRPIRKYLIEQCRVMAVQMRTWIQGSDNTGIRWVRVFFIYRWGLQKKGGAGYYFFGSIRKYRQPTAILRVRRPLKRGQRIRGILLRTKRWRGRIDGSWIRGWDNGALILRFLFVPRGTKSIGACFYDVRRVRVLGWFISIV